MSKDGEEEEKLEKASQEEEEVSSEIEIVSSSEEEEKTVNEEEVTNNNKVKYHVSTSYDSITGMEDSGDMIMVVEVEEEEGKQTIKQKN